MSNLYGDAFTAGIWADVDSAMSDSSSNAVQNKVIKAYVDNADSQLNNQITAIMGDMATVESTSTASQNYFVDDYLIYNGLLYKVTVAIASGGTITPGTNCDQTDVGTEMAMLNANLTSSLTWTQIASGVTSSDTGTSITIDLASIKNDYNDIFIKVFFTTDVYGHTYYLSLEIPTIAIDNKNIFTTTRYYSGTNPFLVEIKFYSDHITANLYNGTTVVTGNIITIYAR